MQEEIDKKDFLEDGPKTVKTNSLAIPLAIVGAGLLIGLAIFGSNLIAAKNQTGLAGNVAGNENTEQQVLFENLENLEPISDADHVRGNPDAPVKIVEYSDLECPFCKRFHSTMQQAMQEYGDKIVWVYRHFPLDSIHSKARTEAVAAECAGELAGNDAFWKYVDRFFELTPSNNQTDINTVLPQIAGEIGLNETQFVSCLTSGKYDDHVQENLDNAIATGGRGTPWSIVIAPNGKKFPLSGAQPYESVKQLIEIALQEK